MSKSGQIRQRILYLQAQLPTPCSGVIASYLLEPVPGGGNVTLSPSPVFPYKTVHEAVIDGWQIVQFPPQTAPISDREVDIPGYQFILQKLEVFND